MRAAEKTIEFVKEWVAGTYTKRQYQNYYIVKTPHAQFLLKQTDNRDLLAIKDNSGHIYVFDDELYVYGYGEHRLDANRGMNNPFLCLIAEGYDFKHTRVSGHSLNNSPVLGTISKWNTLDRVELPNPSLQVPVYLTLVAVGDHRFFISPVMDMESKVPARTKLADWVQNDLESKYVFTDKWTHYRMTELYSNKINSISEIKGNYVTIAGEHADRSWVNADGWADGWVFIPTDFTSVEEITGRQFKQARYTRPSPYAYGLVGNVSNLQNLYRRFETIEENAEALKEILNLREDFNSSNWQLAIKSKFVPEVAEDFIAFFEADDIWLREHFEVAEAGLLESKFRSKVSMGLGSTLLYINREPNLSPMGQHVVYMKARGMSSQKFVKVLPVPANAPKVREIF